MRGLLPDPVQGFISMPDLLQLELRGRIPVVWLPFWAFRTPGRSTEFLSAEKRNCLYCARFAPGIRGGLGCFIYPPSNSLPKEGGPEAVEMDVGLPLFQQQSDPARGHGALRLAANVLAERWQVSLLILRFR